MARRPGEAANRVVIETSLADWRVEFPAYGWGSGTLAQPEPVDPFPLPTFNATSLGPLGYSTAWADISSTVELLSLAMTSNYLVWQSGYSRKAREPRVAGKLVVDLCFSMMKP